MERLLEDLPGARLVLEIGSGTGHFGRFFVARGFQVIGIDLSLPMLLTSTPLGGPPAALADAHRLPCGDGSVDVSLLVATLAFVSDPAVVLAEAARVARIGMVVGALNRLSRLGRRISHRTEEPWRSATPFSVADLIHLAHGALRGRKHVVRWRTTLWPLWPHPLPLPWGDFIGVSVRWA
ncbi:MAG: class I SAM-dependent methyltransferase [Acidobacteria bacterium]|nr:class I SAM-dependent methyltransferase [Acidobacteriota bacterium]